MEPVLVQGFPAVRRPLQHRWHRTLSVIIAGVLACVLMASATPAHAVAPYPMPRTTWTPLSTATSPQATVEGSMAYDPAMNETILFGGTGDSIVNATWAYNGSTWTELSPATSPSARFEASMAYDPSTSQLILFGGSTGPTSLGDTWDWNGTTWTKLAPVDNPLARSGASMAYDPATSQLVLYGGFEPGGFPADGSDTWIWNGTNWTEAVAQTGLPAGYGASMAFDTSSSQLILFGGFYVGHVTTTATDETWSWNGTAWTQLKPTTSPPARGGASMAYDPAISKLVLFGGDGSADYTDTWTWGGVTWTQLNPQASPSTGITGSMTYDAHASQLLYFGGQSATTFSNQTWSLTPVPVNCSAPPGPYVNWAGCDLAGKNLSGADLTGASMAFANLTGANFYAATLNGASFYGATLTGAKFPDATLTNADLSYASMAGATLDNTGMIGVFLAGTYLSQATMTNVESGGISGTPSVLPASTELVNGYLVGPTANLLNAHLAGTNLAGAIVYGANLSGANLSGANLSNGNLTFDTFSSASNLSNATLSGANLIGSGTLDLANRTGVIWTGATCPNGKPAAPSC